MFRQVKELATDTAAVSFMITQKQKQQLADLGYSEEAIFAMKPEQAHAILAPVNDNPEQSPTPPTVSTQSDNNIDAVAKANLDLAWLKIENGLQQEAEGRKLWIEGTLELINNLDDARKRLGDQAFGKWLTNNGYGEDRITRHDRSALLNMALHLNVTREVLEQTHRRSWRLIWEEEIQPRLPSDGQPTDAEKPKAPDGKEPKAPTRRPKRSKGAKNTANGKHADEWSGDRKAFFSKGRVTAHDAIALKNTVLQCTTEQERNLRMDMEPSWLELIGQAIDALSFVLDRFNAPLDAETKKLIREGRVRTTPARASATVQPSA
jgi:hypothetical protein